MYLGLGTNVGDRTRNLITAVSALRGVIDVQAVSSIYETEPVGYTDQPHFWNMVVRGLTKHSPTELLTKLIAIEQQMGRTRTFRNAPRIIDLDILLYGDVVQDTAGVTLPHPRMHERAFVLKPLVELDPELRHPVTGERFADVLRRGVFEAAEIVGRLEDVKT